MGFKSAFGSVVGVAAALLFLKMMACDDPDQAAERARRMFNKGAQIGAGALEGGVKGLSDAVKEHVEKYGDDRGNGGMTIEEALRND